MMFINVGIRNDGSTVTFEDILHFQICSYRHPLIQALDTYGISYILTVCPRKDSYYQKFFFVCLNEEEAVLAKLVFPRFGELAVMRHMNVFPDLADRNFNPRVKLVSG